MQRFVPGSPFRHRPGNKFDPEPSALGWKLEFEHAGASFFFDLPGLFEVSGDHDSAAEPLHTFTLTKENRKLIFNSHCFHPFYLIRTRCGTMTVYLTLLVKATALPRMRSSFISSPR